MLNVTVLNSGTLDFHRSICVCLSYKPKYDICDEDARLSSFLIEMGHYSNLHRLKLSLNVSYTLLSSENIIVQDTDYIHHGTTWSMLKK